MNGRGAGEHKRIEREGRGQRRAWPKHVAGARKKRRRATTTANPSRRPLQQSDLLASPGRFARPPPCCGCWGSARGPEPSAAQPARHARSQDPLFSPRRALGSAQTRCCLRPSSLVIDSEALLRTRLLEPGGPEPLPPPFSRRLMCLTPETLLDNPWRLLRSRRHRRCASAAARRD